MSIEPVPSPQLPDLDQRGDKAKVAQEIKNTLDDIMWRSFALGATILKQYELTLQQALALGAIVRLGPDVDIGKISEATLLAPSTTTSVVNRLVQRSLVSRSPHPTDRRRVMVTATRSGEYLAAEMQEQDLKAFLWMSRDIGESELDTILGAFRHLLAEMEALKPEEFLPGGKYGRKS